MIVSEILEIVKTKLVLIVSDSESIVIMIEYLSYHYQKSDGIKIYKWLKCTLDRLWLKSSSFEFEENSSSRFVFLKNNIYVHFSKFTCRLSRIIGCSSWTRRIWPFLLCRRGWPWQVTLKITNLQKIDILIFLHRKGFIGTGFYLNINYGQWWPTRYRKAFHQNRLNFKFIHLNFFLQNTHLL